MKKIFSYFAIGSLILTLCCCDKDFEKININPTLTSDLDPGYLLSTAELNSAVNNFHYGAEIVQQIITPFTGVLEGGNHNVVYDPNIDDIFTGMYDTPAKLLADIISRTKDDPNRSNLYNVARIWKAYVFQILVDTYGDVPYSEAGKAFIDGNYQPKYDDQKVIYDDLLAEVSDAVSKLDASKDAIDEDIFFDGNIDQWKRLGNSLLLRIAMRLTQVDQDKAKQYVTMAVDPSHGGVMQSNDDNAVVLYNSLFTNSVSSTFNGSERANYYVGAPFVDFLQQTDDPRLQVIAVKYANPSSPVDDAGPEDTDPANQQGMPYGYSEVTIVNAPGFPGKIGTAFKYSQFNRRTVIALEAPKFLVTYAQTELLLAEAAQRGWVSGSAADYFTNGVKAAMEQMALYGDLGQIPGGDITAYLSAHPFNPANALEQINNQYWVASFLNSSEAWANFRRSGYPKLTPNPYPNADPAVKGDFIHRLVYPSREKSVNTDNYNAAVDHMGGDDLGIHLFWEK